MSIKRYGTIEELRVLEAFVDRGGVSAAAEHLGQGQPMISRRLGVFQRGEPLLQRRGRTLELTLRGRRLLPAIRELLRRYDQVTRYIAGREGVPRALCIGTGNFAAEYYLPAALSVLHSELPDWEIRLSIVRGEERILQTAGGRLDFSIVSHDPLQIQALVRSEWGDAVRLAMELLATHRLCVAAASSSSQGRELAAFPWDRAVPVKSLLTWELVGLDASSGVRRQIERFFAEGDAALRFAVAGGGWHAALACAAQGLGVAVVPWAMSRELADDRLVIRRLTSQIRIRDYLLFRRAAGNAEQEEIRKAIHSAVARQLPRLESLSGIDRR